MTKNKKMIASLSIMAFLLIGCTPTVSSSTSSSDDSSVELSTSEQEISTSEVAPVDVDFYAINDLHGRIESDKPSDTTIAKLQTYLKSKKALNPDNYVFLNSGDMFQDTYDSGINRGELLAKTMPMMECEAMATGNHEFDWGVEYIIKNRKFAEPCTFLSANIYHYDREKDQVLDYAEELGDKYKIIERSGKKIGLIGVIGKEQITSIMSELVKDFTFVEPTNIVTDLSDYLKGEAGCDAVVVMTHASKTGLDEWAPFSDTVTSVSPVTGERYVDAVFTGHTHRPEYDLINGVPFIQSDCHGNNVGHVKMRIGQEKDPIILESSTDIVDYTNLNPDPEIQALVDSYLTPEFYSIKNDPVAHIVTDNNGYAYSLSYKVGGNLSAMTTYKMMMEDPACPKDIAVVINNGARNYVDLLPEGGVSKGILYDSIPFTNQTYVARIKGEDVLRSTGYKRNCYYAPKPITIYPDETYTIATTDYMLFHRDSFYNFDRFPSFTGEWLYCEPRYPMDLTYEYLLKNPILNFSEISSAPEYSNVTRGN